MKHYLARFAQPPIDSYLDDTAVLDVTSFYSSRALKHEGFSSSLLMAQSSKYTDFLNDILFNTHNSQALLFYIKIVVFFNNLIHKGTYICPTKKFFNIKQM